MYYFWNLFMYLLLCFHIKLTYHLHLGGTFLTIVVIIVYTALSCVMKSGLSSVKLRARY